MNPVWGRAESRGWPSSKPVYTIAALVMAPLERFYLTRYVRSDLMARLRVKTGRVRGPGDGGLRIPERSEAPLSRRAFRESVPSLGLRSTERTSITARVLPNTARSRSVFRELSGGRASFPSRRKGARRGERGMRDTDHPSVHPSVHPLGERKF